MSLSQGTLPSYIVGDCIPKVVFILILLFDNIENVFFVPQSSILDISFQGNLKNY